MPLSEEELRLLEQMERALVQEDPKFASTLRGTTLQRTVRRRAVVAGLCFLIVNSGCSTSKWRHADVEVDRGGSDIRESGGQKVVCYW